MDKIKDVILNYLCMCANQYSNEEIGTIHTLFPLDLCISAANTDTEYLKGILSEIKNTANYNGYVIKECHIDNKINDNISSMTLFFKCSIIKES